MLIISNCQACIFTILCKVFYHEQVLLSSVAGFLNLFPTDFTYILSIFDFRFVTAFLLTDRSVRNYYKNTLYYVQYGTL